MPVPSWILGVLLALGFLGWLILRAHRQSEDPQRLRRNWIITLVLAAGIIAGIATETGNSQAGAFIVPFVCVALGVVLSILWAPAIGNLVAGSITHLFDGGTAEVTPQPLYSMAIARRHRGRHTEAIQEIQHQLQRFPTDVTGQMLLAEIQAVDCQNLEAAQSTINRFLAQPDHTPGNVASALHLMADWRLKFEQDSDAARQCLEEILRRLPNSPHAHAASQRLAHLGGDDARLARQNPAPIQLKPGVRNIGLLPSSAHLSPTEPDPALLTAEYVRHLETFPQDNEVREKLARVYAGHYRRIDLAGAQLEDLIAQPNAPDHQVVRWLNMLADLQIELHQDRAAAHHALSRIIQRYPGKAAAFQAQQRIELLNLEVKGKQKNPAIRPGSSEREGDISGERPAAPERDRHWSPE